MKNTPVDCRNHLVTLLERQGLNAINFIPELDKKYRVSEDFAPHVMGGAYVARHGARIPLASGRGQAAPCARLERAQGLA